MATIEELSTALRNADAAGDVEAARILASEITRMRSQPAEDPVMKLAREEFAADKARGIPVEAGAGRRFLQGATLNTADEIIAGLATPLEMIKRGTFNPVEAYRSAKAAQDVALEDARQNGGALGTLAEIGGGVMSGVGLGGAGITAARSLPATAGLLPRIGASAADAAIMGGIAGFADGSGTEDRLTKGLQGAAIGGLVGGATPAAISLGQQAFNPIFSNIRARLNPEGFARNQVARAAIESGKPLNSIAQEISDANAVGQPFTLADALGRSGQRMLYTAARNPGPARDTVSEFLNARQAGQGQRVVGFVDEALGAGGSARQTIDDLTAQAQAKSEPLYRHALNSGKAVWSDRLQQFYDDPITKQGLAHGVRVQRLEALAKGEKFDPKDYAITSFNEAGDPVISGVPNMRTINLIKKGWDNILEGYRDSTTGRLMLDEYGRALDNVRRSFLNEVDSINPVYGEARRQYAGPAQVRDAVNMGGRAAERGRPADNIRQFEKLSDESQQGFRAGYADKLAARAERGAEGVNKVRPLTSDKAREELSSLSLYQGPNRTGDAGQLEKRLARENTMFETRRQALGGSGTAENLSDDAAMGIDPTMIGQILSGNVGGALRSAMSAVSNGWNGNTAGVREEVARILLQRGQNVNPAAIQRMLDETMRRIETIASVARQIGRGASGGLAVAPGATGNRR